MDVKCTKVPPQCPRYKGGNCTAYKQCKYQGSYTNADRIRAMSDEELAEFLCDFRSCDSNEHPCDGCKAETYCHTGHPGMLDWLQQPAPEEGEQNV